MTNERAAPSLTRRRPTHPLAMAAVGLGLFVALLAALAGFGSRWGFWHFRTGFQLLGYAAYGGILVILLSVAAMFLARPGGSRRGFPLAFLALVIGLLVVGVPWQWRRTAQSVPPIHDISTDTNSPPQFVAIAPLRKDAPNPMQYGGPEIAAQQREAYPDIRPVILDLPPDRAFERAHEAASDMGWEIVDASATAGRIEATDQTFWFGFKDDVVIRLTPTGNRTVVDVRSLSRVGGSDVGTNAKRVRGYLRKLQDQ